MTAAPFLIGRNATAILAPPGEYKAAFAETHALALDNPFEPELLDMLRRLARQARWTGDRIAGVGERQKEALPRTGAAMRFALARPALFGWLSAAAGCGPLTEVEGIVGQTNAGSGEAIGWHDDLGRPFRRLAVIVNLSDGAYEGGEFELQHADTGRTLLRHRHAGPGSTLIFTVAVGLRHRVLPVTAGGPRRVFAGWFLGPDPVRPAVHDCAGETASPYPAP
jgi:hypothetical protein